MPGRRGGFTLVELMVVVVIITLLAALLLPALNGAVRRAAAAADESLIQQIAMGLETYNQVFYEYVPSGWHPRGPGTGISPNFQTEPRNAKYLWPPKDYGAVAVPVQELTGAAKLFAAMVGFNTLGTGQANELGCFGPNIGAWEPRCGELTFRGILTSYTPGSASEDKVYGPYYLPNEARQTKTAVLFNNVTEVQTVFASRFEQLSRVPIPGGARETGAPILYYAAVQRPADVSAGGNPTPGIPDTYVDKDIGTIVDTWEIYRFEDNFPITNPGRPQLEPDSANRSQHIIYTPSDGKDNNGNAIMGTNPPYLSLRLRGISRPLGGSAGSPGTNQFIPHNSETFILISPGPDGLYFTDDDVKNF